MQKEKILKENYLKAATESVADGNDNDVYTTKMLFALKAMADNDVWPDWRFSDDACNIWSWFHT